MAVKEKRNDRSNVIEFSHHSGSYDIVQEDLLEERMHRAKAHEELRIWRDKRESIRRRLESGGTVEPGPLQVELRPRRKGHQHENDVLVVHV